MQRYSVTYLESALNDIEELHTYIIEEWQNPAAADKVVSKIISKCDRLIIFPNANPVKANLDGRQTRFTHAGKYTVAYYVNSSLK